MRLTPLLALLLSVTALDLSLAADEELDTEEADDPTAVQENFDGFEEADDLEEEPEPIEPDPIVEAAPEAGNAVALQSRNTRRCIGNDNRDKWLDLKTGCTGWRIPQFQYTRNHQLKDIHTGMCLDTRNHLYTNRKAYPILQNCNARSSSQQFYFIRLPGRAGGYKIMTRIGREWMFFGKDDDKDLVVEPWQNCRNCQSFQGFGNRIDVIFN